MLPKHKRLNLEAFQETFKTGRRLNTACLQCIYRKTGQADRFAVVIPKKLTLSKPDANKIKRRFYALIGKATPDLSNIGADIIFILDKECVHMPEDEIIKIFRDLHSKVEN